MVIITWKSPGNNVMTKPWWRQSWIMEGLSQSAYKVQFWVGTPVKVMQL